jgi:hypothetical protein
MNKISVSSLSLSLAFFGIVGCSAAGDSESGSKEGAPAGVATSELTGWLGPISDDSGINYRSFSQANIAATNGYCSGRYCDNMYLYGSVLPTGVTTGAENPTGLFISEESPNNASFCVNAQGYLNGVVTGLAASGGYSDNIELLCSPLSFSGGHYWNSCKWTNWFSEENGGYATGWSAGYYAVGLTCNGSNCDNIAYYICNFT